MKFNLEVNLDIDVDEVISDYNLNFSSNIEEIEDALYNYCKDKEDVRYLAFAECFPNEFNEVIDEIEKLTRSNPLLEDFNSAWEALEDNGISICYRGERIYPGDIDFEKEP